MLRIRPAAVQPRGAAAPQSPSLDQRVEDLLAPQRMAIERERAASAASRQASLQALQGFSQASAELLRQIAPAISDAYSKATQDVGAIGGGFSGEMGDRLRAAQAEAARQVEALIGGAINAPSAEGTENAVRAMGALNPGNELAQSGAAYAGAAALLPATALGQGFQEARRAAAEGVAADREFAKKLEEIAAQAPSLASQLRSEDRQIAAEERSNRLEEQRLGLDRQQLGLNRLQANRDYKMSLRELALNARDVRVRERAQRLYERQFGEEVRSNKEQEAIEWAQVEIRNAEQRAEVEEAIKEGTMPDATLSKVYGYVVDKFGNAIPGPNGGRIKVAKDKKVDDTRLPDPALSKVYGYVVDGRGRPILRNGKRIPVAKSPSKKGSGSKYADAVEEARELRGSPLENPNMGPAAPGKYLARPGAKGVFPAKKDPATGREMFPATTNDPKKARHDAEYTFAEAQAYLMDVYGIPRAAARRALIRAGWKPDGKRPARSKGRNPNGAYGDR